MGSHKPWVKPDWFIADRYSWLDRPFDDLADREMNEPKRWLSAIRRCWALAHFTKAELTEKLAIGGEGLSIDGPPPTVVPGYVPPPTIELLTPDGGNRISTSLGRCLILRLNLDASDADLMDHFAGVLADARGVVPDTAPELPGRGDARRFEPHVFEKWRTHKILQVAEIRWWANNQVSGLKPSRRDQARWIFGGEPLGRDVERTLDRARKVLASAIETYPALVAHVEGKLPASSAN